MAVEIVDLIPEDALYIAQHMRAIDAREVNATRWSESPFDLAVECVRAPGKSWAALVDGIPVAMGGIALNQPAIGQAWLIGTDDLSRAGLTLTRFCADVTRRMLSEDSGINRIQAFSAGFHTEAHAWLKAVGLNAVVPLPKYGKSGEDFLLLYGLRKG